MKGKAHRIPLVLYPFDVLISINQTNNQFMKVLQYHCSPEILSEITEDPQILNFTETCRGRVLHAAKSHVTILRMPHNIITPEQHGHLAHEIFHAIEFIFRTIDIKLHPKSSEAFTYAIQYLTTEIYKQFKI